ncbi:fimbrial protein [Providencia huaxiensis]|uniref:Fimbrial protein n=4 Tax=Providencia TaxID=586 RepID=A0AA42K1Q6_9GAMM|nr:MULTISPECIES: fimbrial protein [Providencia]EJD6371227.1 fimbrial protein [Providencia rettgeri]EJD6375335.1 fimbrial protein [Providencia rettgeri]EJD6411193.1 fimbrial protein [Providencia rettgeri]EJD6584624.1 fimbrial protein [Providencia rettgeri]EJD6661549.1 fimbrial protein [Providencia rettgeri]
MIYSIKKILTVTKTIFILTLLNFLFLQNSIAADIENTCWDYKESNIFNVTLSGSSFTNSKANSSVLYNYRSPQGPYPIVCRFKPESSGSGSYMYPMVYYNTRSSLPKSEYGNGFLKLSDDLDIKIQTTGFNGATIPHTPTSGSGRDVGSLREGLNFLNGSYGVEQLITLRLRKDQLNGFVNVPPGIELFSVYDSIYIFSSLNNSTSAKFYTTGQTILLPIICQINNNQDINIDFGDIDNTRITQTGDSYIKTIPLLYSCNTSISQDIKVTIIANPASFSSDLVSTSLRDDIGIMIKYNGLIVKPNTSFNTVLTNGTGQDVLEVAPVINDPNKSITGEFTASATLVMTIL